MMHWKKTYSAKKTCHQCPHQSIIMGSACDKSECFAFPDLHHTACASSCGPRIASAWRDLIVVGISTAFHIKFAILFGINLHLQYSWRGALKLLL